MIRVTGGSAVYHDGQRKHVITPSDGPVSLNPELEHRFVALGVAAYVDAEGAIPEPKGEVEIQTNPDPESKGEAEGSPDYASFTKRQLGAELDRRGIPFKAKEKREDLIRKLEEDDADEGPTFDALGALG